MKDFFVRDAAQFENKVVTSTFVVASRQIKPKKGEGLYIALTLADRTGQIEAKVWDNVEEAIEAFAQDDFVKIKGLINKYNNRFQLTVHKFRKLGDAEVDYSDYLPATTKDVDALWRTLEEFVAGFTNPHLKGLLLAFMADPQISEAYRTAPAAKTLHHAFIGGLLDHVVSLFRLCDVTSRNYPQIDRDLLLTGAFLHDIGKIYELTYARSFSYTTRGQLLGHMIIELEMLKERLFQLPDFPDNLKVLIEHMIISHHGHYEFGSPKLPMFPEALMLHYLDDLDSKMEAMRSQFEREQSSDSPWTSYNPSLERALLNREKFLRPGTLAPPERAEVEIEVEAPAAKTTATPANGLHAISREAEGVSESDTLPQLNPEEVHRRFQELKTKFQSPRPAEAAKPR